MIDNNNCNVWTLFISGLKQTIKCKKNETIEKMWTLIGYLTISKDFSSVIMNGIVVMVRNSKKKKKILTFRDTHIFIWASQVGLVVKNPPANAGDPAGTSSIPRSGRSLEGEQGNPLQYSCLEIPMDRGVWQATVHSVAKSWTQLKWLSTHTCTCLCMNGHTGWNLLQDMGMVERERSVSRNIKETSLAVSLLILKLDDGHLGLCTLFSPLLYVHFFPHNKIVLILKKRKEKRMLA